MNIITDKKKALCPVTNLFFYVLLTYIIAFCIGYSVAPNKVCSQEVTSPIAVQEYSSQEETTKLEPTYSVQGIASYYSREGCIGCSSTLTMKNGEVLDDEKLTIAVTPSDWNTYQLKNKNVIVTNVTNGKKTIAKVTDTGGFAVYHRIADLSFAVKRSIQCSDLCEVNIVLAD